MLKLEDRKKARAHRNAVNAGEVFDPVLIYGRDDNGNVIGKGGKAVEGTAVKGFTREETATKPEPVDYTKLRSHDDLDAALGERDKPEGWADMKVDDKQKWLTENAKPNGGGWN